MTDQSLNDMVDAAEVPARKQRWCRRWLSRFVRTSTFRRQLSVGVALGAVVLVLSISLLTSWLSGQHLRRVLMEQGERITATLAANSSLALVYAAADNAADAVRSTLLFPDVTAVEVRNPSGRLLSVTEQLDSYQRLEAPPRLYLLRARAPSARPIVSGRSSPRSGHSPPLAHLMFRIAHPSCWVMCAWC